MTNESLPGVPTDGPQLTVIVVSDFEAAEEKTWKDEVAMAQALAAQLDAPPFRTVVVEQEAHHSQQPPRELFEALPDLEVLYAPFDASSNLKDFAVANCTTPWVAVLEADALPAPDWLGTLFATATQHPDFDVFSGRTYYGESSTWRRVLNLLDRSFDDRGMSGESVHVSNNGALYRTEVLRQFPYPAAGSPFLSSRLRISQMTASGHRFFSNREALMQHAVGGFDFVRDFRRNTGYADMMECGTRKSTMIPILLFRRMRAEVGGALRVGSDYLRWYDWPAWVALLFAVRFPEIRGMLMAIRGAKSLEGSAYR